MGCTRSPFSGGLRCCAFCTGPVNPDVIQPRKRKREIMATISCKTCDAGAMHPKKLHRMSGPTVVIGYLLLIPSVLGICLAGLFAAVTIFATPGVMEQTTILQREKLVDTNLDEKLVDQAMNGTPLSEQDREHLDDEQISALNDASLSLAATQIGSGIGAATVIGMAGLIALLSFVGGLIGWILTMRKRVLQCSSCKAVVTAS